MNIHKILSLTVINHNKIESLNTITLLINIIQANKKYLIRNFILKQKVC